MKKEHIFKCFRKMLVPLTFATYVATPLYYANVTKVEHLKTEHLSTSNIYKIEKVNSIKPLVISEFSDKKETKKPEEKQKSSDNVAVVREVFKYIGISFAVLLGLFILWQIIKFLFIGVLMANS